MKKMNAKKVMVTCLVGVLLAGGGIAAGASGLFGVWGGTNDAKQIETNIDNLDNMLTVKEDKIVELDAKVSELESLTDSLLASLGLSKEDNETLEDQLKRAAEEAAEQKSNSDTALAILDQIETVVYGKTSPEKSISERAGKIAQDAQSYHNQLQKEISDLKNDILNKKSEISRLKEQLRQAGSSNASLVENIEKLNKKITELNNTISGLQTENTNLKDSKRELEEQKGQLETEKTALQKEISDLNNSKTDLEAQLKAAEQDVSNLKVKSSDVITKHGGTVTPAK